MATVLAVTQEATFTQYTAAQAAIYALGRAGSYPPQLYQHIFASIPPLSTSETSILVDVGCGTGKVTQDLARAFTRSIGADPSTGMIGEAENAGGKTLDGSDIEYLVCPAEEIGELLNGELSGRVDLIVAGMAAHWFDMDKFWTGAAKLLKPGGAVALWTCASMYCHPSTPNAERVQQILFKFERETLAPYELPGNRISRDMYINLGTPSPSLPFGDIERQEWDKDGIPSDEATGEYLDGSDESLDDFELALSTASMVTRWREDPNNAEKPDCVKVLVGELREAMDGKESFITTGGWVCLIVKKKVE